MGLRKPEQYVEDLKKQRREIYAFGEKVEGAWTEHPVIKPVINGSTLVFEFAQMDEYQDLITKASPLVAERMSRFGQLHKAPTMC
jgi:aromatic ring hydroxylase